MYNYPQEFVVGRKTVKLRKDEEYITLQSLLKVVNIIPTGGMAKIYLEENGVLVNKEQENRRGRKLYPGDIVEADGLVIEVQ